MKKKTKQNSLLIKIKLKIDMRSQTMILFPNAVGQIKMIQKMGQRRLNTADHWVVAALYWFGGWVCEVQSKKDIFYHRDYSNTHNRCVK